jgi:hypothetical protein
MTFEGPVGRSRRIAASIYRIPVLGYLARLIVAFVKLPRLNLHLRRIDAGMQALLAEQAAPSANSPDFEKSWRHNLPLFLNAVSSVGAFGHKLASVQKELEVLQKDFARLTEDRQTLATKFRALEATLESANNEIAELKQAAQTEAELQRIRDEIHQIRREFLAEREAAAGERPDVRSAAAK